MHNSGDQVEGYFDQSKDNLVSIRHPENLQNLRQDWLKFSIFAKNQK